MTQEVTVSQLLPPANGDDSLSDSDILLYEKAWDSFAAGQWPDALEQLEEVSASDRMRDYLRIFIMANNGEPPPNWSGTIPMQLK
jgi:hypothetical protein